MYENPEHYFVELKNPCYANTLRRFFTKVSTDENWCLLHAPQQVPMNKVGLEFPTGGVSAQLPTRVGDETVGRSVDEADGFIPSDNLCMIHGMIKSYFSTGPFNEM